MIANSHRSASLAGVLALHALAAAALLSYAPARSAFVAAAPMMVELISAPKAEPRPEAPVEIAPREPTPKPKRAAKRPPNHVAEPQPQPQPVPIAPVETPAPVVTAPPEPPALAAPEPVPTPPAEVTPPIFNAAYLDNPQPLYPPLSRRIGEQGRVVLRVLVTPSGSAQAIELRSSSGHARLDDAAREAVQKWKFVPAKRGAEPVSAWVLIPVSFRLDG